MYMNIQTVTSGFWYPLHLWLVTDVLGKAAIHICRLDIKHNWLWIWRWQVRPKRRRPLNKKLECPNPEVHSPKAKHWRHIAYLYDRSFLSTKPPSKSAFLSMCLTKSSLYSVAANIWFSRLVLPKWYCAEPQVFTSWKQRFHKKATVCIENCKYEAHYPLKTKRVCFI
jgi:hypothetical protein